MSGLSGYLHGLLQLGPHCRNSELTERLSRALDETARILVTACRVYASRSGSRCPLLCSSDGEEYLGAAYGILGVIQQLLLARPYLKLRWAGSDLDSLDRDILSTLEHLGRYIAGTLAMPLALPLPILTTAFGGSHVRSLFPAPALIECIACTTVSNSKC